MNPETRTIKTYFQWTKKSSAPLNDIGFRVTLIPFFGIAIPLATGLVDQSFNSHWQLKASFAYTILLAFLIWEGNRYLLFTLRSYFNWFNKPVRKITSLLLAISFYTIPLSMLMLTGWYHIFAEGIVDWDKIYLSTSIIMICVVFVTHVYETVFLVKESENEIIKNAQLERAKAEAQLEALKNQIDPHFIFNSLNTLSHLIDANPSKARKFNDTLAEVYRYILQNKSRDLVLLKEELSFVVNYFSLLKIRFEDAVRLEIDVAEESMETYAVPPISIQILVENAMKHNEFSEKKPVSITITLDGENIIVMNNVNKVVRDKKSTRTGLQNLSARYELLTNQAISTKESPESFTVSLPALSI